ERKKSIVIKSAIGIIFFGFLLTVYPRSTFKETSYKFGEPWTQEDLTAPFTFSLIKETEEFAKEKEQIVQETPQIFHVDNTARIRVTTRLDSVFAKIDPVLNAYITWQQNKVKKGSNSFQDSIHFIQLKSKS